jgi:hypothetical protein
MKLTMKPTKKEIAEPKSGSSRDWKTTKTVSRRLKNVLPSALGVLGLLLASQSAHAAWWAASIDGGNGGPNGRVTGRMIPAGALLSGNTFFVFAASVSSGTIYEGYYGSGDWHYTPIYSSLNYGAVAVSASFGNFSRYVAHIDRDWNLRLSTWALFGGGWSTQPVDGDGQSTYNNLGGDVSTVMFGGKLYIFYRESNQPWDGPNVLRCAIYDGAHFTYHLVDGNGGGAGRVVANLSEPSAVATANGLRVYYYDSDHHVLREAYSPDGLTWTNFANLDGKGSDAAGRILGDVGHHPSAMVYNGSVNVFYEDRTNGRLRFAQLWGSWTFGSVDSMDTGSFNAALIHSNQIQVYYTGNGGKLRAAWGTSPYNFSTATLDGAGGPRGQNFDVMYTPVIAMELNNSPTVFYEDAITGELRNSYWVP